MEEMEKQRELEAKMRDRGGLRIDKVMTICCLCLCVFESRERAERAWIRDLNEGQRHENREGEHALCPTRSMLVILVTTTK